jgi:anti-sigma B factor antagonist
MQDEGATLNPAPFEVQCEAVEGARVIIVQGELDLSTAPLLEEELDKALESDDALVVDLSTCEFIDSTGIALIVRAWQRLDRDAESEGHGRFALCALNDQVRRLLDITGLESSIPTHSSRDEALASLRG